MTGCCVDMRPLGRSGHSSTRFYFDTLAGARGFVDCGDDLHVAAAQLAWYLSRSSGSNAVCEVVHLGGLLINRWKLHRPPAGVAGKPAIRKRIAEINPTVLSFGAETVAIGIEAGACFEFRAIRKVHGPGDCLFRLVEKVRPLFGFFFRHHRNRGQTGCHTRGMNDVDTNVHHRAATAQLLLDTPFVLAHYEGKIAAQFGEWPKLPFTAEPHHLTVKRIVVQPITESKHDLRFLACLDH